MERILVVEKGFAQYAKIKGTEVVGGTFKYESNFTGKKLEFSDPAKDPREVPLTNTKENSTSTEETVQNFSESKGKKDNEAPSKPKKYSSVKEKIEKISHLNNEIPNIELSDKDKKILRKLELEHEKKIQQSTPEQVAKPEQKREDAKDEQRGNKNQDEKKAIAKDEQKRKVLKEERKKETDSGDQKTKEADNFDSNSQKIHLSDENITLKPKIKPSIKPRQTVSNWIYLFLILAQIIFTNFQKITKLYRNNSVIT